LSIADLSRADCWGQHVGYSRAFASIRGLTGSGFHVQGIPEPGAAPNGGPATQLGKSGVTEGPPSVS
jgi:hypothetical protein